MQSISLSAYSIWPYFICMAVLLGLASLPAFKAADTPPNPGCERISTLDGLRGFLALAVFFHHSAIYHSYLADGLWHFPPSRFYMMLGPCGVSMFFMITGYLFWLRMLKAGGKPNWLRLYVGRLFRIGPLYLFAAAIVLIATFSRTGMHLHVPATQLAIDIFKWAALGYSDPPVNGYTDTPLIIARVTWTLRREWQFYASLVATACIARYARVDLYFLTAGMLMCLAWSLSHSAPAYDAPLSICAALFLVGMICASLTYRGLRCKLSDRRASLAALALLGMVVTTFDFPYSAGPVVVTGIAFYLIVSGCTLFGMLSSRPARRLGDISYGIYLLQGLVFYLVFSLRQARSLALASPPTHWMMMLLCAVILIGFATITHVCIERTGIDIGTRVAAILEAKSAGIGAPW